MAESKVKKLAQSVFSALGNRSKTPKPYFSHVLTRLVAALPGGKSAQDSCNAERQTAYTGSTQVPFEVWGFLAGSGFMGHHLAAYVGQNWLIDKACAIPANDAVRKGWETVTDDGADLPPEAGQLLRKAEKEMGIVGQLREFVSKARLFGIRVAYFDIDSTDPDYYEAPFNIDGVTSGSYKGIVQMDPYWMHAELAGATVSDPTHPRFYKPEFWISAGRRIHHSHVVCYVPHPVADYLKPTYRYGGKPVAQLILERVYNAERTANEALSLAMSKRLTTLKTDLTKFAGEDADLNEFLQKLKLWTEMRDNHGVKLLSEDDELAMHDTALTGFDDLVMTNYQLVAAAANIPATKLLGTSPKGFNATGEYEAASYREFLEDVQQQGMTPLLERHLLLLQKSDPRLAQLLGEGQGLSVNWLPLDSPTAKEQAEINKIKAETDGLHIANGAIDYVDANNRLRLDKKSDYPGLLVAERGAEREALPEAGDKTGDEENDQEDNQG